jgi:hypothetical protein
MEQRYGPVGRTVDDVSKTPESGQTDAEMARLLGRSLIVDALRTLSAEYRAAIGVQFSSELNGT